MKTSFTFSLLFAVISASAQIAFYDAMILKQHLTEEGNLKASSEEVFAVLDNYIEPSVRNTPGEIAEAVRETSSGDPNPFIEIAGTVQFDPLHPFTAIRNLASVAGDLNVTNLADGLAQFLIERSKDELSVAFFEGFKKDLKKLPELKVLFPFTASFIENIEAYNYASFIQTLREGFQADLTAIPTGLRNLRRLNPSDCPEGDGTCATRIRALQEFFNSNENSILYVASTIVMDSLQTGASIADILRAIADDGQLTKFPDSNISNALLLADIFSASLRSQNNDRIWISREELKNIRDVSTLKLYFGLIYHQCKEKNIKFRINAADSLIITSNLKPDKVNLYFSYLENVISGATEINRLVKEIREKKDVGEEFSTDDYVNYLNASVDVVKLLVNWEVFNVTPPPAKFQDIMTITRSSISIYYNIKSANYSSAVSNAFIILDKTLNDTYQHKEKVLRYGSFMAAVVQAESGEQVKAAIEAVALPAGSASIKKNSQWNISLNSYLGGFAGQEYLADKITDNWDAIRGVSAPIGIGLSHRLWNGSITAFASLLDIGTVVSYRLNDPSAERLPELKLQNIFAPGAGIVFGIPNVPISVGYLTQIGPAIREIDSSAATVSESLNRRYYFFLAVDIPLLNFYTKPK